MRNSYLTAYYNIIPKIQQDRLLEVLKKQYDIAGDTPDDATLETQLERLIAELDKPLGDALVQYRKAKKHSKISSKDYNNTMEEVFVDLGALFKQNNNINRTIKVHKQLNDAVLRDVRSAMRKVKNDIMVYKVVKENKTGITDAKYNTFYKDDNQSEHSIYKAWVDTETDSVKLPIGADHSALSVNGLAMAEIELTHYGGGIRGTLETEAHRKEKAIDESDETFWGEVILVDEPVRQVYDGSTEFGVICEIVIKLFRAELINNIRYKPFANYPLTILKIEYRDDSTVSWTDLDVEETSSTDTMEFNFTEVHAKDIKIVIKQKNPSVNTYKIPKRLINNAQMWQQIVDRDYSISTETETPTQATQDMIDSITGWRAYVDAIGNYKKKVEELGKQQSFYDGSSLSETIFDATTGEITEASEKGADELKLEVYGKKSDKEDELVEVRKYEYVYGAYDIDIKKLWYLESGEYISPMYLSNGAIVETRLDTTDVVPSGTSIEYQVSARLGEWKNILPSGLYITKERLDINPIDLRSTLRFPIASGINHPTAVYMNDIALPSGTRNDPSGYYYTPTTRDVTIASGYYIANAAYTASYQPKGISDVAPSGVVVSFINDSLMEADELFTENESRQYKVELSHYPYIDYKVINDTSDAFTSSPNFTYADGRWINSSSSSKQGIEPDAYYDVFLVTVDGHEAENRTDYYKQIRPALTEYNGINYPYYEYFHSGKNLYFNTSVDDKDVRVIYDYLNDYIQFRALLRSNDRSDVTTTPVLKDYTLKLRTL